MRGLVKRGFACQSCEAHLRARYAAYQPLPKDADIIVFCPGGDQQSSHPVLARAINPATGRCIHCTPLPQPEPTPAEPREFHTATAYKDSEAMHRALAEVANFRSAAPNLGLPDAVVLPTRNPAMRAQREERERRARWEQKLAALFADAKAARERDEAEKAARLSPVERFLLELLHQNGGRSSRRRPPSGPVRRGSVRSSTGRPENA